MELSQDIALGIYCSTMLKNNREFLTDEEKNNIPLNYKSALNPLQTKGLTCIVLSSTIRTKNPLTEN